MRRRFKMSDAYSQYKETQILTATPGKLLVMLYDGAINALEKTIELIGDKQFYDKVNSNLIKAQEIIGELLGSLDMEVGGEFAKNLQSLYAYMIKRLMEANFEKSVQPVEEVLNYMKELREAWNTASQKMGHNANPNNSTGSNFNISG